MGTHVPEPQLVPDGSVMREEYLDNEQVSAHITTYQKMWLNKKKKQDSFNLSGHIRDMLDYMILQDELALSEDAFIPEEDVERSPLDVYVTEN